MAYNFDRYLVTLEAYNNLIIVTDEYFRHPYFLQTYKYATIGILFCMYGFTKFVFRCKCVKAEGGYEEKQCTFLTVNSKLCK